MIDDLLFYFTFFRHFLSNLNIVLLYRNSQIIELSGYVAEEKMAIAKQYLIPHGMQTNISKKSLID